MFDCSRSPGASVGKWNCVGLPQLQTIRMSQVAGGARACKGPNRPRHIDRWMEGDPTTSALIVDAWK